MSGESRIIVCRCEDVSLEEIEKIVDEGYVELEEVKRLLRCGMEACQGRTYTRLIAQIISRRTGKPISEIKFPRIRSPIRPTPLALFTATKLEDDERG